MLGLNHMTSAISDNRAAARRSDHPGQSRVSRVRATVSSQFLLSSWRCVWSLAVFFVVLCAESTSAAHSSTHSMAPTAMPAVAHATIEIRLGLHHCGGVRTASPPFSLLYGASTSTPQNSSATCRFISHRFFRSARILAMSSRLVRCVAWRSWCREMASTSIRATQSARRCRAATSTLWCQGGGLRSSHTPHLLPISIPSWSLRLPQRVTPSLTR